MSRRSSPDFVEALARGLDVIRAFSPTATALSVSDAAARAALPRPTARRLLLTLEQLGYVRSSRGTYTLTSKVLELGTTYIAALGIWELARPHMEALVAQTGESSSMSQLDGSDIVYVARVPVPKIIALSVHIGTRFPAVATSMGHVLMAELGDAGADPAAGHAVAVRDHPAHLTDPPPAGARPGDRPPAGLGAVRRAVVTRHPLDRRAGP